MFVGDVARVWDGTTANSNISTADMQAPTGTIVIRHRYSDTSETASPRFSDRVTVRITVNQGAQEILEEIEEHRKVIPKYRPEMYRPVVREINDSWKAKWRLTQQRPRDGLR